MFPSASTQWYGWNQRVQNHSKARNDYMTLVGALSLTINPKKHQVISLNDQQVINDPSNRLDIESPINGLSNIQIRFPLMARSIKYCMSKWTEILSIHSSLLYVANVVVVTLFLTEQIHRKKNLLLYMYNIRLPVATREAIAHRAGGQLVVKYLYLMTWWFGTTSRVIGLCEGNPPVTGRFPSQSIVQLWWILWW